MKPSSLALIRKLHRWAGLLLAALVIFYCFTGLLLNHRKSFNYFIEKEITVSSVKQSDTAIMREFIDFYKEQIGRSDDPTVIRIRGGKTIEFLYGSHGKTTFIIDPAKGEMKKIDKSPQQPWNRLNSIHKVFKTGTIWLLIADFTCIAILLLTLSGLIIFRYRPLDWLLVGGGVALLLLGLFSA